MAVPGAHDPRTDALLEPATYSDVAVLDAVLTELRAAEGLAWNATLGFWAVTRHADVQAASIDNATFCSGQGVLVQEIGVAYDSPPTMMHTDPPAHTRYRSLVTPAFKPSVIRGLEVDVHSVAATLLDALPTGEPVDVVGALAVPFPIRIIATVLGLPLDREHDLWQWSEASVPGATTWPEAECDRLRLEMWEALHALAVERRGSPRDDVVSMLAAAEVDGEVLRDDELAMFLIQLLVAGNETTRHSVSGAVVALAEAPDQWERLRADRSLVPSAVEEVLRWTTPVTSFMRTATRGTTLGGTAVAGGDPVLLLYASADRDEAVFGATAADFDVGRSPNPHLAFGMGHHFCLGAALARLEIATVLEGLLDRFEALAPAGPVERTGSSVIAGVRHAPVTFSRR